MPEVRLRPALVQRAAEGQVPLRPIELMIDMPWRKLLSAWQSCITPSLGKVLGSALSRGETTDRHGL